jgi:hypothetical protein
LFDVPPAPPSILHKPYPNAPNTPNTAALIYLISDDVHKKKGGRAVTGKDVKIPIVAGGEAVNNPETPLFSRTILLSAIVEIYVSCGFYLRRRRQREGEETMVLWRVLSIRTTPQKASESEHKISVRNPCAEAVIRLPSFDH